MEDFLSNSKIARDLHYKYVIFYNLEENLEDSYLEVVEKK